jgi:hypothetical protein
MDSYYPYSDPGSPTPPGQPLNDTNLGVQTAIAWSYHYTAQPQGQQGVAPGPYAPQTQMPPYATPPTTMPVPQQSYDGYTGQHPAQPSPYGVPAPPYPAQSQPPAQQPEVSQQPQQGSYPYQTTPQPPYSSPASSQYASNPGYGVPYAPGYFPTQVDPSGFATPLPSPTTPTSYPGSAPQSPGPQQYYPGQYPSPFYPVSPQNSQPGYSDISGEQAQSNVNNSPPPGWPASQNGNVGGYVGAYYGSYPQQPSYAGGSSAQQSSSNEGHYQNSSGDQNQEFQDLGNRDHHITDDQMQEYEAVSWDCVARGFGIYHRRGSDSAQGDSIPSDIDWDKAFDVNATF